MKIREQIKDWKNIHAERVTVEKIFLKKEKKEPENLVGKRKKNGKKNKNKGQYEHFLFLFQWLLSLGLTHFFFFFFVLFCWNCIAENFVAQFDVRRSGTIVLENNLSSSMTNDFIVVG